MTAENLVVILGDMIKDTERGKLKWRLEVATSEYQQGEKPVAEVDGKEWTVDECYVAYACEFRNQDFTMVTYENIEQCEGQTRSTNLVFLPPIAMRIFQLDELAPYAVEASSVLVNKIHYLWELLLKNYREKAGSVVIDAREIQVKDTERE